MGRPLLVDPKHRKEVSIVVDQRDLDRIKKIAEDERTSWAEIVRELMKDYINAYEEEDYIHAYEEEDEIQPAF